MKRLIPLFRYIGLAAFTIQFLSAAALAQNYPSKPLRLVVGAAAGGPTDLVSRTLTPKLSESLGQPVLVDNRGGAGGIIGTEVVAKAPPDGYTLAMIFGSHATNPALVSKLPYDTLKDFAPVTMVGYNTTVLVLHPSVPAGSVKELIALAKAQPGKLSYAGDTGSASHVAGELFKYMTGTHIVHIPYKGNGPALTDTVAGHVPLMFNSMMTCLPHIKGGRLRALAVTSLQRSPLAPEIPTLSESGLRDFEVNAWYGVVAPSRTPNEVIGKLNAAIVKVLQAPDLKERFASQGLEVVGSTPEEFDAHIRLEIAKWNKVLKAAGIRSS